MRHIRSSYLGGLILGSSIFLPGTTDNSGFYFGSTYFSDYFGAFF